MQFVINFTPIAQSYQFPHLQFIRQTKLGNTVFQYRQFHAGLKHLHIVASFTISPANESQQVRNLPQQFNSVSRSNFRHGNLSFFTLVIRCKSFQITGCHWFFIHFSREYTVLHFGVPVDIRPQTAGSAEVSFKILFASKIHPLQFLIKSEFEYLPDNPAYNLDWRSRYSALPA